MTVDHVAYVDGFGWLCGTYSSLEIAEKIVEGTTLTIRLFGVKICRLDPDSRKVIEWKRTEGWYSVWNEQLFDSSFRSGRFKDVALEFDNGKFAGRYWGYTLSTELRELAAECRKDVKEIFNDIKVSVDIKPRLK